MQDVKNDNLLIYGEYAQKDKRLTVDFLLEFFVGKLYADNPDVRLPEIYNKFDRARSLCRSRKLSGRNNK